jgi:large subunit ribosomal protein L5
MSQRLKKQYVQSIIPKLIEQFKYSNIHEVPKITKITINRGLGDASKNNKALETSVQEIAAITGQQPVITKARKSVAGFKIREGMPLGIYVTLRREKMYAFLEKFIKLVLPRIRDFRGLNPNNFDKHGNYNIGISEQLVFPEIDYDSVDQRRGFNITIVTSAKNKAEGFYLLKELGVPFSQTEKN